MKQFLRNVWIPLLALVAIAGIVAFRLVLTPVVIETGSMVPTMPVGTVAFIQHSESLKPGDIISFQQRSMSRPTTHTFIGFAADGSLRTKGDANPVPDVRDVPLQKSDVIGKVMFTLPFLTSTYWVSVRGVLSLGIVALMGFSIIGVIVARNRALKKQKEGLLADTMQETIPAT